MSNKKYKMVNVPSSGYTGRIHIEEDKEKENLDYSENQNLYLSNLIIKIILANLPLSVNEEVLYKQFSKFGEIESIKIIPPKIEDKYPKNIAFICFYRTEFAINAKNAMDGKVILGMPVNIKWGKKINIKFSNFVSDNVCNFLKFRSKIFSLKYMLRFQKTFTKNNL
jgi:RNA recognition motif-containing protein